MISIGLTYNRNTHNPVLKCIIDGQEWQREFDGSDDFIWIKDDSTLADMLLGYNKLGQVMSRLLVGVHPANVGMTRVQ